MGLHPTRLARLVLVTGAVALSGLAAPAQTGDGAMAQAAAALAAARVELPDGLDTLWHLDDGLPAPGDPGFAAAAAGFLAAHPIDPADQRGPTLWDTDDSASRQCKCLAYLAAGGAEARAGVAELAVSQAARLVWTLPIRTGQGRQRLDRAFCAAASALAITGALVQRAAGEDSVARQMGEQWLRTGAGQFASFGANAPEGERATVGRLLTALGIHLDGLAIAIRDEAFFAELDLARDDLRGVAARVAVSDWDGARRAYAAVLAERFAARHGWPDVLFDKSVDLAEADDICQNVFILQAHMYRRMEYGEVVDWAKVIDDDIESRVWMNAHPWMWTLMNAYRATGEERYIDHLCRLFESWYETSPPTFERTWAQWRTLEVGGRVGQKWTSVLLGLSEHPRFREACLYPMARSMLDHAKYLSMYAAGGGNWLQVESSGLACVALLLPEFKLSPTFYEIGMQRLAWVNARVFLPDGFQSEGSTGYHRFPLIGMAGALRLAKHLDRPVPESFMRQYEAAVEALAQIAYPDRALPMLSDVSPRRTYATEVFETGAEVFGRADFRWFATGGGEGEPPAATSYDFTHAGYCVMRDRWGADGQVLVFDAGAFGTGHQHEDKLNFVLYAGGRELLGDPGIYAYKHDALEPYWRGSWSHNVITVDGLSQHRGLGPAEGMPDPDRRFVRGERLDYACGWYRRAWSPRGAQVWDETPGATPTGAAAVVRGIEHQRCILYLKGRYAVICDRVTGEGEHELDLLFHPAPIVAGTGSATAVRPVALTFGERQVVLTGEPDAANVAILPAQAGEYAVTDLIGQEQPVRGWYALYGIQPSHDVVYRWRGALPRHCETVVMPLPPGLAELPRVEALPVEVAGDATCAALACGADRLLLSYDGPAEMRCGDIAFEGTALLLERADDGTVRALAVDGRSLRIGGREIAL